MSEVLAHRSTPARRRLSGWVCFWLLEKRWPIPTMRSALSIGATWVVLTVLFEFGFGHYVDGKSWSELLENYNLAEGHLWLLVLLWIALGPAVVRNWRRLHDARQTMPV